jgi:hypothetical protein
MGPRDAYKDMLDNVVSPITCVTNGAMFATPFALALHLHQHQSSRNLHLRYLAKNQSTPCCQSLITPGSDHSLVLEPHMALTWSLWKERNCRVHERGALQPVALAGAILEVARL